MPLLRLAAASHLPPPGGCVQVPKPRHTLHGSERSWPLVGKACLHELAFLPFGVLPLVKIPEENSSITVIRKCSKCHLQLVT